MWVSTLPKDQYASNLWEGRVPTPRSEG